MINSLISKVLNKETINYLIFGILTTAVNYISYEISVFAGFDFKFSTIIAWALAVAFAFITNKIFVFQSKSFKRNIVLKELSGFITSRLLSGIFDLLFMIVAVDIFLINDSISKLASNVFVMVINYILSKLFVFKNKKY